jgi:hypothetical protein
MHWLWLLFSCAATGLLRPSLFPSLAPLDLPAFSGLLHASRHCKSHRCIVTLRACVPVSASKPLGVLAAQALGALDLLVVCPALLLHLHCDVADA